MGIDLEGQNLWKQYKFSGEFGGKAKYQYVILVTPVIVLMSVIYGAFSRQVTSLQLSMILFALYVAAIGWISFWALKKAGIRSVSYVIFIGAFLGFIGCCTSWMAWASSILYEDSKQIVVIYKVSELMNLCKGLIANDYGYTLSSSEIKGQTMMWFWFLESAIIVVGASSVAFYELSSTPYCEKCENWLKEFEYEGVFASIEKWKTIKQELLSQSTQILKDLGAYEGGEEYTTIKLKRCQSCEEVYLLSVVVTLHSAKRKARIKGDVKHQNAVNHFVIPKDEYELLENKITGESNKFNAGEFASL